MAAGKWRYCGKCEQYYRPLTKRGEAYVPERIHDKTVCWPCYDGFFDACYGPDGSHYEYSGSNNRLDRQKRKKISRFFERKTVLKGS